MIAGWSHSDKLVKNDWFNQQGHQNQTLIIRRLKVQDNSQN